MEAGTENVRRRGIYFGYVENWKRILGIDICRRVEKVVLGKVTTMVRLVASVCLGLTRRVVLVLGFDETRQDIATSKLERGVITCGKQ